MVRLAIFLVGLGLFLVGAASSREIVPLPIDFKTIECGVGAAVFTLDVLLIVTGVFLILVAWVFHRINPV